MSLDQPKKNKMIQTPPAKKEYHFAATSEYFAEVVYADTIQEAEELYLRVRRTFNPIVTNNKSTSEPPREEEKDV